VAIHGTDQGDLAVSDGKRLTRSHDRWIAGVCGGIAEFIGWRPAVVRMLCILFSILGAGFGGLITYTILAFVMPPPDGPRKFKLDDFRVQ
jgi:phage shock protein C